MSFQDDHQPFVRVFSGPARSLLADLASALEWVLSPAQRRSNHYTFLEAGVMLLWVVYAREEAQLSSQDGGSDRSCPAHTAQGLAIENLRRFDAIYF